MEMTLSLLCLDVQSLSDEILLLDLITEYKNRHSKWSRNG